VVRVLMPILVVAVLLVAVAVPGVASGRRSPAARAHPAYV